MKKNSNNYENAYYNSNHAKFELIIYEYHADFSIFGAQVN